MFGKNVGKTIRRVAEIIFVVSVIAALVVTAGMFTFLKDVIASSAAFSKLGVYGLIPLFLGLISVWIFTLVLYAFGGMVEDVNDIKLKICHTEATGGEGYLSHWNQKLEELLVTGVINAEEYKRLRKEE